MLKNVVILSTIKEETMTKMDKNEYRGTRQVSVLITAISKVKIQDHLNNGSYSKLLELLKLYCSIVSYNFPVIVVENICTIHHRSSFFFFSVILVLLAIIFNCTCHLD